MKITLFLAVAASLLIGAAPASHAQTKIGTVDMNKIFSGYYKTKDAEGKINEARTTAKNELDERMETYKKNLEAINKLNEEINKPEFSQDMKEQKAKARDEKIAETKNLEREINEFRATREKQLQEQAVRMRNGIVEEITKIVQEQVKKDGYTMVFDTSGSSLNGVPFLVYADKDLDFSESIITALNKARPAGGGTAAPAKKN